MNICVQSTFSLFYFSIMHNDRISSKAVNESIIIEFETKNVLKHVGSLIIIINILLRTI